MARSVNLRPRYLPWASPCFIETQKEALIPVSWDHNATERRHCKLSCQPNPFLTTPTAFNISAIVLGGPAALSHLILLSTLRIRVTATLGGVGARVGRGWVGWWGAVWGTSGISLLGHSNSTLSILAQRSAHAFILSSSLNLWRIEIQIHSKSILFQQHLLPVDSLKRRNACWRTMDGCVTKSTLVKAIVVASLETHLTTVGVITYVCSWVTAVLTIYFNVKNTVSWILLSWYRLTWSKSPEMLSFGKSTRFLTQTKGTNTNLMKRFYQW